MRAGKKGGWEEDWVDLVGGVESRGEPSCQTYRAGGKKPGRRCLEK